MPSVRKYRGIDPKRIVLYTKYKTDRVWFYEKNFGFVRFF